MTNTSIMKYHQHEQHSGDLPNYEKRYQQEYQQAVKRGFQGTQEEYMKSRDYV